MWDELPPLVAIKANKEESKLTFNAYNVSLFDDDLDSDKTINNSEPHPIKPLTSLENTAQGVRERYFDANLQSSFPPNLLLNSKKFDELIQLPGNCYSCSSDSDTYYNVEQITQNKTQESMFTMNAKKLESSDDNNNSNNTFTTLMSKCNLGKAKELLHFANAHWHNELSSSELEMQRQEIKRHNQNKKPLQNANSSSTTSSRIEDAVDMLHAYMSRINSYTLYKSKCTDAYLTDIERAVDRYLLTYFSDNNDTRASMPLVSPVKFVEHLQTNWWPAKHDNSKTRTPTNNVGHNNDNKKSTLRSEKYNNSKANNNNNNLSENVKSESDWSSTAREVAKAGLDKASSTLKNMSSAWFKTQTHDNYNLCNIETEINNNNSSNESNYHKLLIKKGNAERMGVAVPTNGSMKLQMETKFYYTYDVIPEHYTDEAPSIEALQRIRMNYPILLYVLNHTLQHKSEHLGNAEHNNQEQQHQQENKSVNGVQTQPDWTNNTNQITTYKPIQRKWMQSDIAKALSARGKTFDEYTRLRCNLFLPTIKNVWEMYLQPLHDKAIELLHIAEENILQVIHEWKMKLAKETEWSTLCTDERNIPKRVAPFLYKTNKCTSFAKLSKQITVLIAQVDSAVRNLHSDVEYIDKIRRMDDAFTTWQNVNSGSNNCSGIKGSIISTTNDSNQKESNIDDDLHHHWGSIHSMSDQIPVYGLILSRLHRLEMEHRTVLELWDHA